MVRRYAVHLPSTLPQRQILRRRGFRLSGPGCDGGLSPIQLKLQNTDATCYVQCKQHLPAIRAVSRCPGPTRLTANKKKKKKEQQSEGKIPRVQAPAFSLTTVGVLLDDTNNSAARSKPTYPPTIAAQCHVSFGDAIVKKSWSSASWRRFFPGAWRFPASGRRLFFRCPDRNRLFLGRAHLRMPRQRSWGRGEFMKLKLGLEVPPSRTRTWR
ncbi:hypothetical protein M441DRAFT_378950 [Trichoderma asperellum CBS 433.97]|uniref:Uncharacterized protein n=1 Tax=Trichoderma asperellum (strain ATCC 204424 / CBS 433.97 / NBRC 101777) TaxID=1042311 RepID=A0A2T3ZAW5_TRIA4|nr:hypothetical protein M441DRAFT_378950 [Trichoderma asperellum CBS 433.97]PTB41922.1 hypothetical protein M441DRAFT_378950 [Trichoderma asperellum CBS 433.97]